jgi:tetratricopeptide (TPR) repeat protein
MWILVLIVFLFIGILIYKSSRRHIRFDVSPAPEEEEDQQVERNLKGIELEKKSHVDKAVELYEQNISENFDGNHPYDRLAVIYRKRNQIDDEIRVLEKAVWVFENIVYQKRPDRLPKLNKLKKRLQEARKLKLTS